MKRSWADIRRCRCPRQHRTYRAFAKCVYRRARVTGEGPFALVVHCDRFTVTLWGKRDQAEAGKAWLEAMGCGGRCRWRHRIVRLRLPALDPQEVLLP